MGGELFDSIVQSGSYSERKAAGCFRKMVDMLHHCHELGVMHRDLKPENFLLTSKKDKCADCCLTPFSSGCCDCRAFQYAGFEHYTSYSHRTAHACLYVRTICAPTNNKTKKIQAHLRAKVAGGHAFIKIHDLACSARVHHAESGVA